MKTEISLSEVRSRVIRLPGRPPFMLARDLASLYRVTPGHIGEAVSRNPERFPEPDFCFRIPLKDADELKSHFAISNWSGNRKPILVFTRLGANMLSAVLKSRIAAERAVLIMRAFTAMEESAQQSPVPPPAHTTTVLPTARYIQLLEAENAWLRRRKPARAPRTYSAPIVQAPPLSEAERAEIWALARQGLSLREISLRTGRCISRVWRTLQRAEPAPAAGPGEGARA